MKSVQQRVDRKMLNEHRYEGGGGAAPLDSTGDKNMGAEENEIEHPSKPGF